MDDFFTIGKAGSSNGTDFLRAIKQAATDTGIPLAPEKCEGPVTCMNFLVILGIELDSVQMTARLPPDKLRDLVLFIKQWIHKKQCKPKELQSLVGKLNRASSVVVPGRTFMRQLINLLRDSQHHWRFIELNNEARLDLKWWSEFLPALNGVCFFDLPEWTWLPDFQLATDASGSKGFGAYNNGEWFHNAWLSSQPPLGMAYKELYPECYGLPHLGNIVGTKTHPIRV